MTMKENRDGLAGHFQDLAKRSFQNSIYTFTHFLGESELSILMSQEKSLQYAGLTLFGGAMHAERLIARFGREADLGYDQPFPIACLRLQPLAARFGEELSHRDYLGALMHLGIERELLGDIYVEEHAAYVLCMEHIAGFIMDNLSQVRHTTVQLTLLEQIPQDIGPRLAPVSIIAASERLDAVIARIGNLSRSQSQQLFRAGKVFINGRQCDNSSSTCHPGDRISVRGIGKFIYDGVEGITGKGRCRIRLQMYQ